jgi:hypothetical protein
MDALVIWALNAPNCQSHDAGHSECQGADLAVLTDSPNVGFLVGGQSPQLARG